MQWFIRRLCCGMPFGAVLAGSTFAQHALARSSLLDFLNAQADYRSVQVNYLNPVAAYLDAANQLNLAVGREVIQ